MTDKTAIEIIQETISVDEFGNVSFRKDTGRGRGRKITIPSDQFDRFAEIIKETAQKRKTEI